MVMIMTGIKLIFSTVLSGINQLVQVLPGE